MIVIKNKSMNWSINHSIVFSLLKDSVNESINQNAKECQAQAAVASACSFAVISTQMTSALAYVHLAGVIRG